MFVSWHFGPDYPPLYSAFMEYDWSVVIKTSLKDLDVVQIVHRDWPFLRSIQSVAKVTWYWRKFLILYIAHMRACISECNGERLALVFFAPISPSKPCMVLYQPYPENISWAFYDPHQRPVIEGNTKSLVSRGWFHLWLRHEPPPKVKIQSLPISEYL